MNRRCAFNSGFCGFLEVPLSQNPEHTIIQASENLAQLIECPLEQLLGQSLQAILGASAAIQVEQLIVTAEQSASNTAIGIVNIHQNQLDAHLYLSERFPVLELSNDAGLPKKEGLTDLLLKTQHLLFECDDEKSLIDYLQQKADLVRSVTGYDNVMIYRFDENWDGQVIAQSRVDAAPDYLGTYFPATDIPPQARALYTQNLVRIVTNVDAEPIALHPKLNPQTELPLDMTLSSLRSVSPIHLQYLRNMGTAATMTISLLQNGKLWGLIACHHLTPKRISVAMREIAHLFSRQIALKLAALELYEQQRLMQKAMDLSLQIMASFSRRFSQLPNELLPKLMKVVDATGVVVMVDGERFVEGITPSHGEITLLLAWLNQQMGHLPFACSQLSSQYADAQPYQDKAAGLLAIRLSSDMQNGIIWLRQEQPRTVNWAGVYSTGLKQGSNGDYYLTPRNSFEVWRETWQGRSLAWSANELALSQLIGNAVSQALLNKHLDNQLTEATYSRGALLDLMPNGILIADTNRRITYVNADFEKLTGYSHEELLGKSCSILQGPESDPQQIQAIKAAMNAQQPFFGEILNYRKDGTTFWNDLSVSPIFDSKHTLTQFVGIQHNVTERKLLEKELLTSEMRFRQLADAAPVLIWQADVDKNRFWFNKNWLDFTGRSLQHQQGYGWVEGLHPEDSELVLNSYVENFDRRQSYRTEYRLRRADGEYRWIDAHGVPHFSEEGEFEGYVGTCTDITDVRNSKAATDFFNVSHEMIFSADLNGIILDCNQRFSDVTGYSRDFAVGKHSRFLKSGMHDSDFYDDMFAKINSNGYWRGELINRHKDGSLTTFITTISTVYNSEGKPHRYLVVASDISSISHRRQELENLAYYDTLTGLPNRLLLQDRLSQSMTRVRRRGGFLAVLFIDLDGFKAINDHYGHEVGDEFLAAIGQKMKSAIRESDTLARLGGDEFVVILDDLESDKGVEQPVANLLQSCNSQILLNGLVLKVSSSIGVALYPSESSKYDIEADMLLRCADQAMYVAKQQGKNRHHYFDGNIDQAIITRNNSIQAIKKGLVDGEFELYYQPIVNMHSGEVLGFDGVIRWNHLTSLLLSPSVFLPTVQNHPVGIALGYWVINQALVQISEWQAIGVTLPISINIDARLLHQPDFVENLTLAIANHPHYKAGLLTFEILETIAITDQFEAKLVIDDCRALGIEFALNDFGSGYSSIAYLRQLPIKTIKLDRSFIANITQSHEDLRLVTNIMSLAQDMGKQLVVDGIETIAQGEMLIKIGCELAQGYAIANPMRAANVISWLSDWQPELAWTVASKPDDAYRFLFERMNDPTLVIKDGRFTDCNDAAIKFLGYDSKASLLKRRPCDISPLLQPDGRRSDEKAEEILQAVLGDGIQCFEWLHHRVDGAEVLVEVMLTPIKLNNEWVIHTVWRDLSHRR